MIARYTLCLSMFASISGFGLAACSDADDAPPDDAASARGSGPLADGGPGDASLPDAGDAKSPAPTDAGATTSCNPIFASGTAVSNCLHALCTSELAACNGDCDCPAMSACGADCFMTIPEDSEAQSKCIDTCKAKYPVGAAKFLTLATCLYERCSTSEDGGTGAWP